MYGGIDLGGTKIEVCLHDANFVALERKRVATPENYDELMKVLTDLVNWLKHVANRDDLPIGMGIPGFMDDRTGLAYTANLCAMGRPLARDLKNHTGMDIPIENDGKCFVLSEANQGAHHTYPSLFGLILGTGVGGGFCRDGQLQKGWSGGGGEVGHLAAPAHLVAQFNLPLVQCGCSRMACYETYLGGDGLALLGQHICGRPFNGEFLAEQLGEGNPQAHKLLHVWAAVAGELIHTIQLTFDPEYIVLGGGLSLLPHIDKTIADAFEKTKLPSTRMPQISIAKFGDSGGVRGAAMLGQNIGKKIT